MWALEIKSKNNITKNERKGLIAFAEDYPKVNKIIVTLEGRHFIDQDNIEIIPIFDFLKKFYGPMSLASNRVQSGVKSLVAGRFYVDVN